MASTNVSCSKEAFILLSIGIIVICLRTYARIRQVGIRNLEADDYLMLLVIIPYTIESGLAYMVRARFHGLTNSWMTDDERDALLPQSDEYRWRVGGSKIQVAGWTMYATVLWVIKSALCAFYFRLTASLAGYKTRIYIGFGMILSTYAIVLSCILLSCQPFNHFWQINPDPGNLCQPALSKLYIFIVVSLNIATDVYLLAIPIPMLWGAGIPKVKRYGLLLLFSGAIFVIAAGLLRCFLILYNPQTGPQQGASWAVRESFVAIVTSNIPSTWAWMRQKLKPVFGSLLSSNKNSSKSNKEPQPESIKPEDNRAIYNNSGGWSTNSTIGYGNKDDPIIYTQHNSMLQGDDVEPCKVYIPNFDGFSHEGEFAVEVSWARYL
ncbi:Ff.00g132990.m01.CDS01 [Fusarium sp. VM40]|nr:Ff.00g132990.m01.CDS01 [Fusarium sp. VM40]